MKLGTENRRQTLSAAEQYGPALPAGRCRFPRKRLVKLCAKRPRNATDGRGPAADSGHPPGRDRYANQLAQQRGPVDGDVVAADQVRGLAAGLRPVTSPCPHVRRKVPRASSAEYL